jgi:hypothetical protein
MAGPRAFWPVAPRAGLARPGRAGVGCLLDSGTLYRGVGTLTRSLSVTLLLLFKLDTRALARQKSATGDLEIPIRNLHAGGQAVRLPRLRITLRTMMAVVAALAIGFGITVWTARRAARFRALRDHHRVLFRRNYFPIGKVDLNTPEDASRRDRAWYHYQMAKKYTTAALHPWLPIEEDPSEPN